MRSNYIGGRWVPSASEASIDVVNPATEAVIDRVPAGTPADVDAAVEAASAAFPAWSATTPAERARYLASARDLLEERADAVAAAISADMGSPLAFARSVQVGTPLAVLASYVDLLSGYDFGGERVGNSLVVREPIGVVGAITPWNYPLHQIAAKVAPALAAGCTVVLKPSEVAPLNAFVLAEIFEQVGLPPGVFNLVTGFGPVVGEAIAAHPDVDMVSFTGSTRAGRRVSEVASATVKRVALELGGKSANVILDDADLAQAVPDGVRKCYINSGQTCSALTRMLVPRDRLSEASRSWPRWRAESLPPADPFDGDRLGPLVSAVQRDRVRNYIDKGHRRGRQIADRWAEAPDGLGTGFFVRPTVFSSVTPDMTIARDEIFGPVLAIIPYDSRTRPSRSPTTPSTDWPAACGPQTPDGRRRWPAGCGPVRSRSTAGGSIPWPRSGATSSRATGANSAPRAGGVPRGQIPPVLRLAGRICQTGPVRVYLGSDHAGVELKTT